MRTEPLSGRSGGWRILKFIAIIFNNSIYVVFMQVLRSIPDESYIALAATASNAAATLARLEERLALSPVGPALASRLRFLEQAALAWADGQLLDPDSLIGESRRLAFSPDGELMAWSACFGRPLERSHLVDADAMLAWLGVSATWLPPLDDPLWGQMARRSGPAIRDRVARWTETIADCQGLPPLFASAWLAGAWKALAPLGRGDRALALLIGDRWLCGASPLSAGGLVALGLKQLGRTWTETPASDELDLWLRAVEAAAGRALQLERDLRLIRARCEELVTAYPRARHLGAVLELALATPSLTPRQVEKRLGVSFPTAVAALERGREGGVLRELTGQASYRRFAVAKRLVL